MATSDAPLNVPNVTLAVSRGAASGGDINLPVANLYKQTFESKTPNPGDLNNINFNFSGLYNNLGTDLDGGTTGGVVNTGNGIIDPPIPVSGKDWRSYEGNIHMRVRLPAQTNTANPEQNATFDPIASRDTWVRYWWRVPTNYYPPTNHLTGQHKFFVIFQDGYSTDGTGTTNMLYLYGSGTPDFAQSGITYSFDGRTGSGGHVDKKDLFNYVERRGQWMQLVMRHRLNSAEGAGDGSIDVWYRWDGETAFTLQHGLKNLNLERALTVGKQGFTHVRFSSAREGDVADSMDLLFDVIEMADTPLVPVGTEGF